MKTVADILRSKSSQAIYTIGPDATVLEAISLMAEKGIGALVVTHADAVVGIVSERDYARKIILMERSSYDTPVSDIMTAEVMYVDPRKTNQDCMALMTENRMRHLPVLENGRLLGLISIGDLVKDIITEQKFIIDQLQQYITGDRG